MVQKDEIDRLKGQLRGQSKTILELKQSLMVSFIMTLVLVEYIANHIVQNFRIG